MASSTGSILSPLGPQDPRQVSGYRLVARVGEGGMGTVYLSYTRGNQPVALKVIRREYGQDPGFRRRFEQEVRAARRVQGYHLVPVVDHDTSGELPWLASAFIPGIPLHDALTTLGPLPVPAALQLVGCAARALTAIHAAGVVHRDLKPSNIMLSGGGPYVIDFGIARAVDATQLTQSGALIGTPQYMSPEHALGDPVGPATDVFSLGLIAAVAATGRHPYGDGGAITVAAQIANTAHRPPRLDGYDPKLRPLLARMLTADPAERIGTEELAALCQEASGRSAGDFDGWLPAPFATEIARREREVLTPPAPAPPTVTAAPHQAPYTPTLQPSPAPKKRGARAALIATALVAAVAAGAGTAVYLLGKGDNGGTNTHGERTTQPVHPPTHEESQPPSPTETGQKQEEDDAGYVAVVKARPFALRSPGGAHVIGVDLDVPKVKSPGDISGGDDLELSEVSGGDWEFKTPMGKSAGTTAAQCLEGSQSDVLPSEIEAEDLRATLPVGTVLCTQTDENRLAMLEVTGVSGPATGNDLPDISTKLTLWKRA
ncbi:serine/threonine-protein kinase [Streptomyces sp. NPDC046939]|uniref:serine/threonine-protein kinase n=1 Tax=Streptomyces sp. NPDC046939 TaxID=3155376 RepID=UPI0033E27431